MSSWWSPLHPGATWGVYPRHHHSGSPWVKSQLEAGGISMCPKFRNGMVDSSISLGVFPWVKKWAPAMTFWSKTLPATFFRKHVFFLASETVNPVNKVNAWIEASLKGEASEFREDKIDVFASERKRSLSETPSPTCRACFRYALTRTPAEELNFLHCFTSFSIPCVSSTCNIRCKEGRHCFQRWCITWTG